MPIHIYDFIRAVKQKLYLPEGQTAIQISDIINNANDLLATKAYISMSKLQSDFGTVRQIVDLQDPSTGANKFPLNLIPLPRRAFGNGIIELKHIENDYITNIPLADNSDYEDWFQNSSRNFIAFFFISDGIQLLTADKSVLRGQIEIFYQVEPSTIIYPADSTSPACIEIQNLIYDATTTTVNILVSDLSLNNTYLDYNGGIRNPLVYKFYDILSKKTGQPIYLDMPLAQVSTEAFISKPSSFTKDMVDNLNRFQYGGMPVIAPYTSDFYLVPTGMTDRIPLPPIAENWLVSLVSRECLANIGDLASMQMLDLDIKEEKKEMESVLARRIQKEQYKLNGGNALHSFICK